MISIQLLLDFCQFRRANLDGFFRTGRIEAEQIVFHDRQFSLS